MNAVTQVNAYFLVILHELVSELGANKMKNWHVSHRAAGIPSQCVYMFALDAKKMKEGETDEKEEKDIKNN